jgi:hypothetical protein
VPGAPGTVAVAAATPGGAGAAALDELTARLNAELQMMVEMGADAAAIQEQAAAHSMQLAEAQADAFPGGAGAAAMPDGGGGADADEGPTAAETLAEAQSDAFWRSMEEHWGRAAAREAETLADFLDLAPTESEFSDFVDTLEELTAQQRADVVAMHSAQQAQLDDQRVIREDTEAAALDELTARLNAELQMMVEMGADAAAIREQAAAHATQLAEAQADAFARINDEIAGQQQDANDRVRDAAGQAASDTAAAAAAVQKKADQDKKDAQARVDALEASEQEGSLLRRLEAMRTHGDIGEQYEAERYQRQLDALRIGMQLGQMSVDEYNAALGRLDQSFTAGQSMNDAFGASLDRLAEGMSSEVYDAFVETSTQIQTQFEQLQQQLESGAITTSQFNTAVAGLNQQMSNAVSVANAAAAAEQRKNNMMGRGRGFTRENFREQVQNRIIAAQRQRFSRNVQFYANRLMATTPGLQHLAQNANKAGNAAGQMASGMQQAQAQMAASQKPSKEQMQKFFSPQGILAGLMSKAYMAFSKAAFLSGKDPVTSPRRRQAGQRAVAEFQAILATIRRFKAQMRQGPMMTRTPGIQMADPGLMTGNRPNVSISLPNVTRVNNEDIRGLADRLDQEYNRRGRQMV